jgi:hypothetical protein
VRPRHHVLAAALGVHLLLVVCGACNFAPWARWGGALRSALCTYGDFTGARYSFGFFAPGVPNPVVADVAYTEADGRVWHETLGSGTREIDHRMTTMMTFFTVVETDDLHATTLALNALRRHPEAAEVAVSLRCYNLPSMSEWRSGVRPAANEYYWGRFRRRSDVEGEE